LVALKQNSGISKDRYSLGTKIKSQLRGASYSVPVSKRRQPERGGRPRRKEKEMTEMALRSRMAVLVVAALLSIGGALGTEAFLAADDADAAPYNPFGSCMKTPSGYIGC
jgi:hypothetical protein